MTPKSFSRGDTPDQPLSLIAADHDYSYVFNSHSGTEALFQDYPA
jgi:hypothetical protein